MARVSRVRLDKITYTQVLNTLDLVLGKLKKDEVRTFLFSLMSGTERLMIAKRFAAITLLQRGFDDRTIAERLKITRATINKLKLIMKVKDQGFALSLKKLNQDKMAKEINQILLGLAKGTAEVFLTHRIKPPDDYPKR